MALAERLTQVSRILHEFGHDNSDSSIQRIIKFTKNSGPSKAVVTAARRCSLFAQQRLDKKIKSLEMDLQENGWNCKCWLRPIDKADSPYWPSREIAISVNINDFESDAEYMDAAFSVADRQFNGKWPYRIVPVINGFVVAPLAMLPSSSMPLPDQDFEDDWQDYISVPFVSSHILEKLDEALAACIQVSAIVTCRNLDSLHPDEDRALSDAIETVAQSHEFISRAAEESGVEEIVWISDYVSEYWNNVVDEFEAAQSGKKAENPLCISPHETLRGLPDDRSIEIAGARVLVLQAECFKDSV